MTDKRVDRVEFSCDGKSILSTFMLVCQLYDTQSATCFQRTCNNSYLMFADQETMATGKPGQSNAPDLAAPDNEWNLIATADAKNTDRI